MSPENKKSFEDKGEKKPRAEMWRASLRLLDDVLGDKYLPLFTMSIGYGLIVVGLKTGDLELVATGGFLGIVGTRVLFQRSEKKNK